jgi:hypothetical protein
MLIVGFLEGLGSERGIAARCGDSLTIRRFLGAIMHLIQDLVRFLTCLQTSPPGSIPKYSSPFNNCRRPVYHFIPGCRTAFSTGS